MKEKPDKIFTGLVFGMAYVVVFYFTYLFIYLFMYSLLWGNSKKIKFLHCINIKIYL